MYMKNITIMVYMNMDGATKITSIGNPFIDHLNAIETSALHLGIKSLSNLYLHIQAFKANKR